MISRVLCVAVFLLFFLLPCVSWAATWDYTINDLSSIDAGSTTAVVDTSAREIRLPGGSKPDVVSFWPSGEIDYVVLTENGVKHYSYDGASMVENTLLSVDVSNPLALAAINPYPDVVVASLEGVIHYGFSGSGMVSNPALSVAGLTGIISVGAIEAGEISVLDGSGQVQHFSFTGEEMVRNTFLEPAVTFANPLDVALASGGYDTVVLETNRVRWFNFTGSGMDENPALEVTGLADPKVVAVADPSGGYDIAVVDGTQVKHFSFDGSAMVYNAALSVTSGLTAPRAVAIRPGTNDRIIVDGNEVRYYLFDGTSLVYNEELSVVVPDIVQGGGFSPAAVAVSREFDPGREVSRVRVRAAHELPNNTTVTWSVTADGTNWVRKWRVRGTVAGTILEASPDNGNTWVIIGSAADAAPDADNVQLWAATPPGRAVRWKAELATVNTLVTPKVATSPRGGVAVRLETNSPPNAPLLPTYGSCFTTSTPTLTWAFSDPDAGDSQSAYRVQIVRASDMGLVHDSLKVADGQTEYKVPASDRPDEPSDLWSSGAYMFKYRVKVWDRADEESPWSDWADFCVNAFDRPRIAEIVSPPEGQEAPDPQDESTHLVITEGMVRDQLPRVKAGAKVVLLVDSIGPIDSISATFLYASGLGGTETAVVRTPPNLPDGTSGNPMHPPGSAVNRWAVEFWTNPSLEICPSGTLVEMTISGSGGEGATVLGAPPYAEGVVVTEGSIWNDFFVVLQGRDTD